MTIQWETRRKCPWNGSYSMPLVSLKKVRTAERDSVDEFLHLLGEGQCDGPSLGYVVHVSYMSHFNVEIVE